MENYLPPELLAHDSKRENNDTFMGIAKEKRGKILDTLINNLPDIVLIKKQALLNRHLQSKQAAESDDSFHKILYP